MLQAVIQSGTCILLCTAFFFGFQPSSASTASRTYHLELVHRQQKAILASYAIQPGDEFSLHYTHSSDHTPVVARFQVTPLGRIVLVEEKFAWYGAGLAFHPQSGVHSSQGWSTVRMHREMDPFFLRVGRVAGHTLHIEDQTIALQDIAPGGTCLWIRVRGKGEFSHD